MTGGEYALLAALALPAAGALAVVAVPARFDRAARRTGFGFAAAAFLATLLLARHPGGQWSDQQPGSPAAPYLRPWHELDLTWVPGLDLRFHLGVDGISYPLVVLTALLTLLCCGYTLRYVPTPGRGRLLVALLLVIECGILGTFLALDLVLFFLFFEVVLLPMYAVIAIWGGDRWPAGSGAPGSVAPAGSAGRASPVGSAGSELVGDDVPQRAAARKFALYTLFGSVLLLVGVFTVVAAAGTADIVELTGGHALSRHTELVAFTLFAIAFAVKSPLWPLHTWLPDAHTQAPTVGSVILAGVLLKMGTYGLIRIGVGVTPEGAVWASAVLGVLAVAAIIIGSLVCLAQVELKRLIAYSSVGHMGFVLLGVATLSPMGIEAALIGNVAHGVITALLFFLAGAIKERAHTGSLVELGGLRERAPHLSGLLAFAAIASLGLPGLAGFWGEAFAIFAAMLRGWTPLAVLAAIGGALTAAYFLRLLRRVTHGRPSAAVESLPPGLARAELAVWWPLVLLTLAIGLAPTLVLGIATDPVQALLDALPGE